MKEGDVVLTVFEQTDGRTKNRPARVAQVAASASRVAQRSEFFAQRHLNTASHGSRRTGRLKAANRCHPRENSSKIGSI